VSAPVDLATGTAGCPQRVGLATDLVLVHKVFRRELRLLPALVGAVPAVIAGGAGTVLVVALWTKLFGELARRDRMTA
jgi:hypothetical protein